MTIIRQSMDKSAISLFGHNLLVITAYSRPIEILR